MMFLWFAFVGASVGAGVAPLTTSNFSSVTGNPESLWLVKFYAPWCGHCKRLAPILDEVADEVEGVTIGKVDATIETALRDRYSVKGYPTLLVMQHGKTWEHRGQRNKPGILKLIERMKQPAVATLATEAELRAASRPVLFLLGRADSTDEPAPAPAHALFEAVAHSRKHVDTFVATEAGSVLQAAREIWGDMGWGSHRVHIGLPSEGEVRWKRKAGVVAAHICLLGAAGLGARRHPRSW